MSLEEISLNMIQSSATVIIFSLIFYILFDSDTSKSHPWITSVSAGLFATALFALPLAVIAWLWS